MDTAQSRIRSIVIIVGIVLILLAGLIVFRIARRGLSQNEIRERVVATIQGEARSSFLVTGNLDLTATTSIENTKTFLPGILNIDLGTSRATVQVPGRAHYGFDVREIDPRRIIVRGDTIEMSVPPPKLLSVDPNLQELRIFTQKGWLRTPASVAAVEKSALQRLDYALSTQAALHIAKSAQPHINSAHALEKMLRPALAAAGMRRPVFRFRIGERLILED
jgi:hypothetical protein